MDAAQEYPLKHKDLVIKVMRKGNVLYSLDNRRLYCFKEAQRWLYHEVVHIRVQEHVWAKTMNRFRRNHDTLNDGASICVRR